VQKIEKLNSPSLRGGLFVALLGPLAIAGNPNLDTYRGCHRRFDGGFLLAILPSLPKLPRKRPRHSIKVGLCEALSVI
jgi:hypothetical protein